MTIKLIQKSMFKGTREFELAEDAVHVRIKKPFKEEKLTVSLSMLNPEPVINNAEMEFHGRFKGGALVSLLLNKPDVETFDSFVDQLKLRAVREYHAVGGGVEGSLPEGMAANVFDEPPELDEFDQGRTRISGKSVDPERMEKAIELLRTYLVDDEIAPLLSAMESLKADPQNESNLERLLDAYNGLGIKQGAVLTYAPYIGYLLTDDPYRND